MKKLCAYCPGLVILTSESLYRANLKVGSGKKKFTVVGTPIGHELRERTGKYAISLHGAVTNLRYYVLRSRASPGRNK